MGLDRYRFAERILIGLAGLLAGIALVWFTKWQIDPRITLGEIFGGLITILLAWIVSVLIEKGRTTSTALNSLLLQRVEEIRLLIRETHSLAHRQAGEIWSAEKNDEIVANLRGVSLLLTDLEELTSKVYETDLVMHIKQHYFKYKQVVTNTSSTNPLTADRMIDAESIYRDIRAELTKIIVEICRR
jgi:hypothetical protein